MTSEEESALVEVIEALEVLGERLSETNAKLDITDTNVQEIKYLQMMAKTNRARNQRTRKIFYIAIMLIMFAFIGQQVRTNDQISCISSWGQNLINRNVALSSPSNLRVTYLYELTGAALKGVKLNSNERDKIIKELDSHRKLYPLIPTDAKLKLLPDLNLAQTYALVLGQDQDEKFQTSSTKHPIPKLDCPFWSVS